MLYTISKSIRFQHYRFITGHTYRAKKYTPIAYVKRVPDSVPGVSWYPSIQTPQHFLHAVELPIHN